MQTLRCCEVYTPGQGKWQSIAPLQVPRSGSRIVALEPAGGQQPNFLAAVGGCDDIFGRAETQPSVELFDVTIGQWFLLPRRLEQPRTTAAVVAVSATRLLVIGGAPSLDSAEIFDIPSLDQDEEVDVSSQATKRIAAMSEGRMGCQASLMSLPARGAAYPLSNQRCVAVVGGERCSDGEDWVRSKQFSSVPVYDLTLGVWRDDVIPPMAAERTAVAVCVGLGCITTQHRGLPEVSEGRQRSPRHLSLGEVD